MLHHFLSLILRSWRAMTTATSTNTFGFLVWTVALTVGGWVVLVGVKFLELKDSLKMAVRRSLKPIVLEAGFVMAMVVCLWFVFVVRTIYVDHQALVSANQKLLADASRLGAELEWRKHNISATDAVFPNLIYMLQAFRSFGRQMNGTPCVLYVTAPRETAPLASVIVQLAGPDTGCSPFGPVSGDNPDLDPEVTEGAVPDAIVVHAIKGEKAADSLFTSLGNEIHLERSYRLLRNPRERWVSPYQGKEHVVWLQFGRTVKWNSEPTNR